MVHALASLSQARGADSDILSPLPSPLSPQSSVLSPQSSVEDGITTGVRTISAEALRDRLQGLLERRDAEACDAAARIVPGLLHRVIFRPEEPPVLINCFQIDLSCPELTPRVVKAGPSVLGRERLETIAERWERETRGTLLAGVNGGFWDSDDRPVGALAGEGRVYTASNHQWTFLLGASRKVYLGPAQFLRTIRFGDLRLELRGLNAASPTMGAHLYTADFGPQTPAWQVTLGAVRLEFEPGATIRINAPAKARVAERRWGLGPFDLKSGSAWLVFLPGGHEADLNGEAFRPGAEAVLEIACDALEGPVDLALSAGPMLVRQGRIVVDEQTEEVQRLGGRGLEARTGLGVSADGTRLFLMTIDGSRYGLSRGATLADVGRELIGQGAFNALNLDGGSSTAAWAGGDLVNRPSGLGGSRPIANGLFVSVGPVVVNDAAGSLGRSDKSDRSDRSHRSD